VTRAIASACLLVGLLSAAGGCAHSAGPRRDPPGDGVAEDLRAAEQSQLRDEALLGQSVATGQPPDCARARLLRDNICALAERICTLTGRSADARAPARCQAARARCQLARARVAGPCG
jgi:hypothetical protein